MHIIGYGANLYVVHSVLAWVFSGGHSNDGMLSPHLEHIPAMSYHTRVFVISCYLLREFT